MIIINHVHLLKMCCAFWSHIIMVPFLYDNPFSKGVGFNFSLPKIK